MQDFVREMRIAGYSPVTIKDRLEVLDRLANYTGKDLIYVTADELEAFQDTFAHLAPSSVNIYTRHLRSFYRWALRRRLIAEDLADTLIVPKVPRGRPHPTTADDMHTIFACTSGALRIAYVLAAFAGLRRGEVCRLQRQHLDLSGSLSTALIQGKGGKERTVPLLRPVVNELHDYGLPRQGFVVKRNDRPYQPAQLSIDSHHHLAALGVETTLHSMRHFFATQAARTTRDPLFIRDLLGHASVSTTEIYMDTTARDGHMRLAGVTTMAEELLPNGAAATPAAVPLRAVSP